MASYKRKWVQTVAAMGLMLVLVGCQANHSPDRGLLAPAAISTPDLAKSHSPIEQLRLIDLHNPALTVQIAPQIGRIYGLITASDPPGTGQNLLWHDDLINIRRALADHQYVNWGGDKVWPGVQSSWARQRRRGADWPPDAVIDGSEWHIISQSDRQLVMQSSISDDLGIQITRSITLDDNQPRVTITNTITRVKLNPMPVMIWSITQVRLPTAVLLNVATDRPAGEWAVLNLSTSSGDPDLRMTQFAGALQWRPQPTGAYKLGTFGRWIAAIYDHHVLVQATTYDPDACYPDRSNIQMYSDPLYMELETLSPSIHLAPGQSLKNTVVWILMDRSGDDAADLQDRISKFASTIDNPHNAPSE